MRISSQWKFQLIRAAKILAQTCKPQKIANLQNKSPAKTFNFYLKLLSVTFIFFNAYTCINTYTGTNSLPGFRKLCLSDYSIVVLRCQPAKLGAVCPGFWHF